MLALPAAADPPRLGLPLDCRLGETCVIEDYVDSQPGPGQRDYACGLKSRDDHNGIDFALISHEQMAAGVSVLAAAPGVVRALRDGVEDLAVTPQTRAEVKGKECGNAVAIRHEDGWETLYCHMAKGSIAVRQGQRVERGMTLGKVGLSGLTNFPHVHMRLHKDGQTLDPFRPVAEPGCGIGAETLWIDPPAYSATGLFIAGIATGMPSLETVQSGAARVLETGSDSPALFLYAHMFHAEPGDQLDLRLTGPEGTVFDVAHRLTAPKPNHFSTQGGRPPGAAWAPGLYRGQAVLRRGETILAVRHAEIRVR